MPLNAIRLRVVQPEDLAFFLRDESDEIARRLAAFAPAELPDEHSFAVRWERKLADDSNVVRTILCDDSVAGNIGCFTAPWSGQREVCYWISRSHWGRGVATEALRQLLEWTEDRPLHARVAVDNPGSIRVLEKCGFVRIGMESEFAPARGCNVEEVVLRLQ